MIYQVSLKQWKKLINVKELFKLNMIIMKNSMKYFMNII